MHGQVAVFIAGEIQLFDIIPAADIGAQLNQLFHRRIRYLPVRRTGQVCNLNGNRLMVVFRIRAAPGTVFFLDIHADPAVIIHRVVRACLPGSFGEHSAALLDGHKSSHMMDGNLFDCAVAWAGFVGTEDGIIHKFTVTHEILLFRFPSASHYMSSTGNMSTISLFQIKHRHFRRHAKPDRIMRCPDTAVDIQRGIFI